MHVCFFSFHSPSREVLNLVLASYQLHWPANPPIGHFRGQRSFIIVPIATVRDGNVLTHHEVSRTVRALIPASAYICGLQCGRVSGHPRIFVEDVSSGGVSEVGQTPSQSAPLCLNLKRTLTSSSKSLLKVLKLNILRCRCLHTSWAGKNQTITYGVPKRCGLTAAHQPGSQLL